MKQLIRFLALALVLACLVPTLALGVLAEASAGVAAGSANDENDVRFTEKIVSVLYDNSGSMDNSDLRDSYASYALQMLMALLNPNDTLVVTPMNERGKEVTSTSQGFEVNLSASDRNAEIKKIISQYAGSALFPDGNTPPNTVNVAVEQLQERGLPAKGEEPSAVSQKEYWLVVLTDGEFNSTPYTEDLLSPFVSAYPSLKTIYLGIGSAATDLSGSSLTQNPNFSAYCAKNSTEITSAMQSIANRMSGRYTLPLSALKANGNKISVNLASCDFPLRSVSFVAQNCDAVLTSAVYGGKTLQVQLPCEVIPDAVLKRETQIKNGYSGVVEGDPFFAGGTLELTFSAPVDPNFLSVMVEPALYVKPTMECNENGSWISCDTQYVSDKLTAGDTVRMGYEVYEEGSNKKIDLDSLFGSSTAKVSADGKTYQPGDPIPLKSGKNEITMAVSVMDNAYTIYATVRCMVEEDPSFYRAEGSLEENADGSPTKTKSTFTVFVNNTPLTKEGLADYTWKVTATDPAGQAIPVNAVLSDDGKVVAELDAQGNAYGIYSVTFTVTSAYGVSKTATTAPAYYPSAVTLTPDGASSLSVTQHQFKSNTKGFSFLMTADGKDFVFDNGLTQVKVTLGNEDITSLCTVEGNRLSFVPTAENLPSVTAGDTVLKVTVTCPAQSSLKAEATATLTVIPTVYDVTVIEAEQGEIDRYRLSSNQVSAYFAVSRDGEILSSDELEALLANGELTVDAPMFKNFFLPVSDEITVETLDGVSVVRCRVKEAQWGFIRLFTSMFLTSGEKEITASLGGVDAVGTVTVARSSIFSFIWRILLLLLILHIIMILVLMKKSPRHRRGYLVTIVSGASDGGYPSVNVVKKNMTFTSRIVPARLINPMASQKPYRNSNGYVRVSVNKNGGDKVSVTQDNCLRFRDTEIRNAPRSETFKRFCRDFQSGQMPHFSRGGTYDIKNGELRGIFPYAVQHNNLNSAGNVVKKGESEQLAENTFYAFYDATRAHKLRAVVFFVSR